jgi:hypothetical protein
MERLRATAIETNRVWAERLGINQSAAVTCTKPAGNSATLLGTSSGISPRESPYYIRHVRAERSNPLTQLLQDAGVPWHPEVGQNLKNYRTCVFAFPVAAPENAITYDDMSARDQFLNWLEIKKHYTEHNPSVTLRVGSEEWMELGYLVYQNWDCVGGLSFLPRSDFIYQLAPYQRITKEEYERLASAFPKIPWERLPLYEGEADNTTARQEYACSAGGSCDI